MKNWVRVQNVVENSPYGRGVMGQGNKRADLVIVTDEPASNGSVFGRSFTGRESKVIRQVLEDAKIDSKKVYITNAVKVKNSNRRPETQEIDYWRPILKEEINLIRPKKIITIGNVARQMMYGAPNSGVAGNEKERKAGIQEEIETAARTGEWRKGHLE